MLITASLKGLLQGYVEESIAFMPQPRFALPPLEPLTLRRDAPHTSVRVPYTEFGGRQMATGYLWHELYGWNDTGSGSLFPSDPFAGLQPVGHHFAHPDNKRRMHELLMVSGMGDKLPRVPARYASREEITRVHAEQHHDRIVEESKLPKGGDAGDGISPFGKGGYEIAALAAGGAIAMVDAVVKEEVANGFALVNPCGHHAPRDTGMGFCVFNNVAIAAKYAREVLGSERVAIVDWDVHHGNGTQAIFWEDPSVLTISVHQDRYFPTDQGFREERGEGLGANTNLNIPLPPGTGDAGYIEAMDSVIVPALRTYAPDLVIVACGFDPSILDPLCHQMVSAECFGEMTKRMVEVADDVCDGKLALVQEGGYSIHYVAICGAFTIAAMAGLEPMTDPYLPLIGEMYGRRELEDHQVAAIKAAAEQVPEIPSASYARGAANTTATGLRS